MQEGARASGASTSKTRSSPLVRTRVTSEDGRPVEYVVESAVGPLDLAAQRLHKIAKGSEPEKLALTDPSGEHEHGRNVEDIEREFDGFMRERGDEEADKGDG